MSEKSETSRIEAFCDGVFAIAITLLILDIKIPLLPSIHSEKELRDELLRDWPSWFGFLLSFAIVFIAGFCIVGSQGALNALSASYYPTDLRSTGVGAGLGVGRVGGIVGPYIGGALLEAGWTAGQVFYTAAIPALISAITMLALRRILKPQKSGAVSKSEVLAH